MIEGLKSKIAKGFFLSKFNDEYSISIEGNSEIVKNKIKDFYTKSRSKLISENDGLEFECGSFFWSIFNFGPEKFLKHSIRIKINEISSNQIEIAFKYSAKAFLCLRFPPFGYEKEVKKCITYICE